MGISVLYSSLIAGFLTQFLKNGNYQKVVTLTLVVLVIAINVNYFKPESYFLDSIDEHYISKEKILYRNDKTPKDYLPIWVKVLKDERVEEPHLVGSKGEVSDFIKKPTKASFNINTESESEVDIPIYYFPGWEVKVNGKLQDFIEPGELGFIRAKLPKGESHVALQFKETPLRKISNLVSLVSFSLIGLVYLKRRQWKSS